MQVDRRTEGGSSSSYTFASAPRPIANKNAAQRKRYRDPSNSIENADLSASKLIYNIMTDSRIRRGTTVTAPPAPMLQLQKEAEEAQKRKEKQFERMKRERQREKERQELYENQVEAVEGRLHMEIQTDEYLEEITDRPVEKDIETQTDEFNDRPPSPQFVPKKSGVDAETQIWEGDLFNFDEEVEPILSVLIAKVLEQSILEVRDEEEAANIKAHQEAMDMRRAAELAETGKLEEEERRKEKEKEERLAQERDRIAKETKLKEKRDARRYAKQGMEELTPTVFNKLTEKGYFYDQVSREVETIFQPWLLDQVDLQLQNRIVAKSLVQNLLESAIAKGRQKHLEAKRFAKEEAEREAVRQADLAIEQSKRIKEELEAKDQIPAKSSSIDEASSGEESYEETEESEEDD